MLLPVLLMVAIPLLYFVVISMLPAADGVKVPEGILRLLPGSALGLEYRPAWIEAFTTLLCPMLFLCIPLLTGAVSASCAFVAEKEAGTLETLLLTSMEARSVFNVKISCCTLLSCFLSLLSFVAFFITVTVVDVLTGAPFFLRLEWLVLVFLLMPALSLFSVVFVSLIISRVYSTGESLQTMGYLILPIVILYLMQFAGVFPMNWLVLLVLAAAAAVAAVVLYNVAARNFQPEALFVQPQEE